MMPAEVLNGLKWAHLLCFSGHSKKRVPWRQLTHSWALESGMWARPQMDPTMEENQPPGGLKQSLQLVHRSKTPKFLLMSPKF